MSQLVQTDNSYALVPQALFFHMFRNIIYKDNNDTAYGSNMEYLWFGCPRKDVLRMVAYTPHLCLFADMKCMGFTPDFAPIGLRLPRQNVTVFNAARNLRLTATTTVNFTEGKARPFGARTHNYECDIRRDREGYDRAMEACKPRFGKDSVAQKMIYFCIPADHMVVYDLKSLGITNFDPVFAQIGEDTISYRVVYEKAIEFNLSNIITPVYVYGVVMGMSHFFGEPEKQATMPDNLF